MGPAEQEHVNLAVSTSDSFRAGCGNRSVQHFAKCLDVGDMVVDQGNVVGSCVFCHLAESALRRGDASGLEQKCRELQISA